MRETIKTVGVYFFFIGLVAAAIQLFMFRQYATEAAWLLVKEQIGIASLSDFKKLGAICNSLRRTECSYRVFKKIVEEAPNDLNGLANLAINLAIKKQYQEAEVYFNAYFSAGGSGEDVYRWYNTSRENIESSKRKISSE